ncbi:glycosyltransferase family 15 protein [Seminavis robusta]|uniref:Glycosyltransferase family 15 protein n=1 Tax=Seminavis robusta TaxID=568900 RepID=A0A9N8DY39_9STRA|nr:glycosyltransferase family 15 protein [Seminavis robusta]|eukprot:Sro456_g146750.1 glycosyltransferase family 15 protein (467) ;mRNA; f:54901-56301
MRVEVKVLTTLKDQFGGMEANENRNVNSSVLQNASASLATPRPINKPTPNSINSSANPRNNEPPMSNKAIVPHLPDTLTNITQPNLVDPFNGAQDQPPSICEGGGKVSRDAIVMLMQKKHSTYAGDHTVDIAGPLLSLQSAYKAVQAADVLLWHEGEFALSEIPVDRLQGMNVRLCNLKNAKGVWGPPPNAEVPPKSPEMPWSVGYRNMIRFYAVTIWDVLSELGYDYVMRLDDDSNFMSPIAYNLFDALRSQNAIYGFRQEAEECGSTRFGPFIDRFIKKNKIVPKYGAIEGSYCKSQLGRYGYYNNFFISRVSWWHEPLPSQLVHKFDESSLIYTHRDNDLIFQTAVVKLFAEPQEVLKYVDWTYAHVTVNNGEYLYGGVSFGTEDPDNENQQRDKFLDWMAKRWHIKGSGISNMKRPIGKLLNLKRCPVTNRLCAFSNCTKSGEHVKENQIGPRRAAAPACSS